MALASLLLPLAAVTYLVRSERWSVDVLERSPMEFVRYAERRLIGHPRLQWLFGPALDGVRAMHEREPAPNLPTLGKGQQSQALLALGYDAAGRPRPSSGAPGASAGAPTVIVRNVDSLVSAMASASAGEVLEVAPGTYTLAQTLQTGKAGMPERPIKVRASAPGTVEFVVTALEAVKVTQPYWVFENFDWRGACANHDDCEHAFHVAGRARGAVILNNRMQDFNVHIKINGEGGAWPDDGLLQYNTLSNATARLTRQPVTAVNINGASGWQIADNSVQRIIKGEGNRTSSGICVKGAAQQVQVERNLVVCTPERVSQQGLRVGITMGCGGSTSAYCRDGRCDVEASGGAVSNNVIAHCNDFGIDLSRVRGVLVSHNTLINTAGIDARQASTRATAVGNLVEGRVRDRDGAVLEQVNNKQVGSMDVLLKAPDALDLRWNEPSHDTRATPETERDFCGQRRPPVSPPGATVRPRCERSPATGTSGLPGAPIRQAHARQP